MTQTLIGDIPTMTPAAESAIVTHSAPLVRQEQQAPTVETIMLAAVEKGADVETLERLVALQRKVTEDRARAAYVKAIGTFRSECPPIVKNKTSHRGRYADLSHISKVIEPYLYVNGLMFSWDCTMTASAISVTCKVSHTDGHCETSTLDGPIDAVKGNSGVQNVGVAQSYLKRLTLINALGLIVDDDLDGRAEPNPGPAHDGAQPNVAPRGEREQHDDTPRVTLDDLRACLADYRRKFSVPTAKVGEFTAWAKKHLKSDADLSMVGQWDINALEAVQEALR